MERRRVRKTAGPVELERWIAKMKGCALLVAVVRWGGGAVVQGSLGRS